ncbi:uncharacterized protein SRS1_25065 [Sporisorium reilianum f. sp. reilianum]|uniref:Uncharacterized protein n=1 Tax=Sporisorium reilianum f. sp. reilianum TaxID=72559 RepID=A0A2N8UM97_9BASI|nr:uncharacterized protein SRS1_25065 [Sporisorium reilianum f. sp. reilianum]
MKLTVFKLAFALVVLATYCRAALTFGAGVNYVENLRTAVRTGNSWTDAPVRSYLVEVLPWTNDAGLYNRVLNDLQDAKGKYAFLGKDSGYAIYGTPWNGYLPGQTRQSEHIFLFGMSPEGYYKPLGFADYRVNDDAHSAEGFRQHHRGREVLYNWNAMNRVVGFPPDPMPASAAEMPTHRRTASIAAVLACPTHLVRNSPSLSPTPSLPSLRPSSVLFAARLLNTMSHMFFPRLSSDARIVARPSACPAMPPSRRAQQASSTSFSQTQSISSPSTHVRAHTESTCPAPKQFDQIEPARSTCLRRHRLRAGVHSLRHSQTWAGSASTACASCPWTCGVCSSRRRLPSPVRHRASWS